jgi:hypothetical protein
MIHGKGSYFFSLLRKARVVPPSAVTSLANLIDLWTQLTTTTVGLVGALQVTLCREERGLSVMSLFCPPKGTRKVKPFETLGWWAGKTKLDGLCLRSATVSSLSHRSTMLSSRN